MQNHIRHNKLFYVLIINVLMIITGCSDLMGDEDNSGAEVTENPDAEEILSLEPEANIFQYDGVIYQSNIDWVEELSLTKNEQVGEIKKRNEKDTDFEDGMSNKLPVGAKIFSVKKEDEIGGPALLVESDGVTINYYGLVEG